MIGIVKRKKKGCKVEVGVTGTFAQVVAFVCEIIMEVLRSREEVMIGWLWLIGM